MVALRPFQLERYLARWEFGAKHFLSASDCESMTVGELLSFTGSSADSLLDLHLGYTESEGDPRLRQAIGAVCDVDPRSVIVTNAPEEAIFLLVSTLVRPGDRVVVQTPCYQSLSELALGRGGEVLSWPMVESESRWDWDLGRLAELLATPTRLLIVNAPHNPTGFQPPLREIEELAELCAVGGTWLFCDQMYRGLERDSNERLPFAIAYPKMVSLWGTSKSFGLPGLRIGWLSIGDQTCFEAVMQLKDYTTICSSAPGMLLARLALESAEDLMAINRRIIARNVDRVEEFMARQADSFVWVPPAAGPVAFARLRRGSADALCARALERRGLLLVPSPIFDWDDSHLRLGLGRRAFGAGLDELESLLDQPSSGA